MQKLNICVESRSEVDNRDFDDVIRMMGIHVNDGSPHHNYDDILLFIDNLAKEHWDVKAAQEAANKRRVRIMSVQTPDSDPGTKTHDQIVTDLVPGDPPDPSELAAMQELPVCDRLDLAPMYDPEGGMKTSNINALADFLEGEKKQTCFSARRLLWVVFDWDRTLTKMEGVVLKTDKQVRDMTPAIVESLALWYFGGKDRLESLRRLFAAASKAGVGILILTANTALEGRKERDRNEHLFLALLRQIDAEFRADHLQYTSEAKVTWLGTRLANDRPLTDFEE